MTLLGGMYTTWGPVIGAVLLGIISEYLKLQIPYGHLFVYGLIIVIAILFFPRGIVGTIGSRLKNR
jgi:branched-chain amino acid transport system permease protein